MRKAYLWLECLLLFGVSPFFIYYLVATPIDEFPIDLGGFQPRRLLFPFLWAVALAAMWAWRRKHRPQKIFNRIHWDVFKKGVLPRFILSAFAMTILTYMLDEARFFFLPLELTGVWLIVLTAYPLISVVPQEVIFRLFFFDRYEPILGKSWTMILISGVAFGHAHIIFNNIIAYVLSIAGGIMFSITYARTRNLSLVWLEHATYGQFLFTVGLGWYFYTGAVANHG